MTPQYPGSQSDPTVATKEKRKNSILNAVDNFLYVRKAYIMRKLIFAVHVISLE